MSHWEMWVNQMSTYWKLISRLMVVFSIQLILLMSFSHSLFEAWLWCIWKKPNSVEILHYSCCYHCQMFEINRFLSWSLFPVKGKRMMKFFPMVVISVPVSTKIKPWEILNWRWCFKKSFQFGLRGCDNIFLQLLFDLGAECKYQWWGSRLQSHFVVSTQLVSEWMLLVVLVGVWAAHRAFWQVPYL